MKHIKYIFLLLVMLSGLTIRAQEFNPDNPPEPAASYLLTVKANPAEAATVTGGGRYNVNQSVRLQTSPVSVAWKFLNWTKTDGSVVNKNASFYYTTTNAADTLIANYEKLQVSSIQLSCTPEVSMTMYGAGVYAVGKSVDIICYPPSDYKFLYWANEDGVLVSESSNFSYVVTEQDVQLVAHLKYSPGSPAEPSETKPKHNVFLKVVPEDAGYFANGDKVQVIEGNSVGLTVYNYANWMVEQIEMDGVVVSDSKNYTLVMGTKDVNVTARMRFNPGSPGEPAVGTQSAYTLYGMQANIYKGETLMYPVYMENTGNVTSLHFSMLLPKEFSMDLQKAELSSARASAYTLQGKIESENDTGSVYSFEVSGGTEISGHNGVLLHLPIKVNAQAAAQSYMLRFETGSAMVDGVAQQMSLRPGSLVVSSLDETGLRAQFTVDSYLNRVMLTNHSTEEARSFVWDFGDGTTSDVRSPFHIYPETGGLYQVKLTAKGMVTENVAEQTIHINPISAWSASGDYTLNSKALGVRNFQTMNEMVGLLSQCAVEGNIRLTLQEEKDVTLELTDTALQSQFTKWTAALEKSGYRVALIAPEGKTICLNLTLPEDAEVRQTAVDWCRRLSLSNVQLAINGAVVNFDLFNTPAEQRLCTGMHTALVPYSGISADSRVSVSWEAIVKQGCQLSDYMVSGQGDLPEMVINNAGTKLDQVNYNVMVNLDNQLLYHYHYTIYVKPSIQNSSISYFQPSDKAELSGSAQNLDWNDVAGAIGYRVEVKRMEQGVAVEDVVTLELEKNSSSCRITRLQPGCEYSWQVFALGECDELAGEIRTFTIAKLSDLLVQEVKTVGQARGLSTIQIVATVMNSGQGTTYRSSWSDAVYASAQPNDFQHAEKVVTLSHRGSLKPGESYQVSFEVKVPDVTRKAVYYYVKTDCYDEENQEESETNNISDGQKVEIVENFMNAADYAALKVLSNATNGGGWSHRWNITSNAIAEGHWPGVVFDNNGNVLEIHLSNNKLVGELPAEGFVLPELTKLVLSQNRLKGDIALFVKSCPKLKLLDLEDNELSELSEPLSPEITDLRLGYQHVHYGREKLDLQQWQMAEIFPQVDLTKVQQYDHEYLNFYSKPDLDLYSQENGRYLGSLKMMDGEYHLKLSGDYKEVSGAELDVRVARGLAYKSCLRAILSYKMGDANADGLISILDAQQTLNRILGRQSGNFNFTAANAWTDDRINVQDIVKIINLFVDEPLVPEATTARCLAETSVNELQVISGDVVLNSCEPIAAFDMTLQGITAEQVELCLPLDRFQMVVRKVPDGVRVVIFSPTGDVVPVGESKLLALQKSTDILRAECANVDARSVMIRINRSEATGIENGKSEEVTLHIEGRSIYADGTEHLQNFVVVCYGSDGKLIKQEACHGAASRMEVMTLPANFIGAGVVELRAKGHPSVNRKIFIK